MRQWRQKASSCSGLASGARLAPGGARRRARACACGAAGAGAVSAASARRDLRFVLRAVFGRRATTPSERPVDSRARRRRASRTRKPANTVLVLGNSMADWLAYGLEDALSDTPEIGVVRKHRTVSGLIRYDSRNEAQRLGAGGARGDRGDQAEIHRHDARPERSPGDPRAPAAAVAPPSGTPRPAPPQSATAATPVEPDAGSRGIRPSSGARARTSIIAPEPQSHARGDLQTFEFRTEQWAEHYTKRIDDTIAALKSERRAGVLGRLAVDPRAEVDQRHALSQRPVPRPRREGRHHLHRRVGWLRRRKRPLRGARARLRRPDPAAARRRRRAFHQGRRAQARALSSSAKSAA